MGISHRGYVIIKRHRKYVATDDQFEIFSAYLPRLLRAIDALWRVASQVQSSRTTIDHLVAPLWLREWMSNATERIDLDATYSSGAC